MDGTGREQDGGKAAGPEDELDGDSRKGGAAANAAGEPIYEEGRGTDRHGGGALAARDKTDKAVSIQSIVQPDDYAGSSESGV